MNLHRNDRNQSERRERESKNPTNSRTKPLRLVYWIGEWRRIYTKCMQIKIKITSQIMSAFGHCRTPATDVDQKINFCSAFSGNLLVCFRQKFIAQTVMMRWNDLLIGFYEFSFPIHPFSLCPSVRCADFFVRLFLHENKILSQLIILTCVIPIKSRQWSAIKWTSSPISHGIKRSIIINLKSISISESLSMFQRKQKRNKKQTLKQFPFVVRSPRRTYTIHAK